MANGLVRRYFHLPVTLYLVSPIEQVRHQPLSAACMKTLKTQ